MGLQVQFAPYLLVVFFFDLYVINYLKERLRPIKLKKQKKNKTKQKTKQKHMWTTTTKFCFLPEMWVGACHKCRPWQLRR